MSPRLRAAIALTSLVALGAVALAIAIGRGDDGPQDPASSGARNVILIVGDGLGAEQRRLIREATVGRSGRLSMDGLRYSGLVSTANAEGLVTDSAAGATAFATGVKTRNGTVGVDRAGTPVASLLDLAGRGGKSTGLVSTSHITDATPAAFAASASDRAQEPEIARQYVDETRPTVMLGGGRSVWPPALLMRARQLGYRFVSSRSELERVGPGGRLLGLFDEGSMFAAASEGRGGRYRPSVPLPVMARVALRSLSTDREGFFLLIEEEAVDDMAHSNNAKLMIKAGRDLDATVRQALTFARRDRRTLVVVVGDHETGGLRVVGDTSTTKGDGPLPTPDGASLRARWTTTDHTGADVPLTAEGPGAHRFGGRLQNTDVFRHIVTAARLPAR